MKLVERVSSQITGKGNLLQLRPPRVAGDSNLKRERAKPKPNPKRAVMLAAAVEVPQPKLARNAGSISSLFVVASCATKASKCKLEHGDRISDDKFKAMRKPSCSPSARGRKSPAKDGGNEKFIEGADGKKIPKHCRRWRATGACKWEESNPGSTCKIPHLNEAQYQAEFKKINS